MWEMGITFLSSNARWLMSEREREGEREREKERERGREKERERQQTGPIKPEIISSLSAQCHFLSCPLPVFI
jgi:hypothetical protein